MGDTGENAMPVRFHSSPRPLLPMDARPRDLTARAAWPGDVKALIERLRGEDEHVVPHWRAHLLSAEPTVVYVWSPLQSGFLGGELAGRQADILMKPSWTYHRRASARLLRRRWDRHAHRHPGHRLRVLCNSDLEVNTLRREGIDAEVVHQNAMVDERVFDIDEDVDPEFDAVYDAQLAPFKRHDLARRLESLALITYLDRRVRGAVDVAEWTRRMPGWHWLNWPAGDEKPTHFKQPRLARELARCRLGLCLSPVEGAMYASMQYLLCGLPVVSVPSFGGRDAFFEPDYAAVVPADANAVAAGVKEMLSRNLPRREVRDAVLSKVHIHRRRLIDIVQSIYDRDGVRRRFADEWPAVFRDKLMSTPHVGELRAQLAPPAMVA